MSSQFYKCPTCGATKEIEDRVNPKPTYPAELPCGWRGCKDRARSLRSVTEEELVFIAAPTFASADRHAREHRLRRWKFVNDIHSVQGYRPPYRVVTLSFGSGLTPQQLDAVNILESRLLYER